MYAKMNNVTAAGTRQIVVNPATGMVVGATTILKDGKLITYQQGDGVLYTAKSYLGDNPIVLNYLNSVDEDDGGLLVTESNKVKTGIAQQIGPMLTNDCFGYMSPLTVSLGIYIQELVDDLIEHSVTYYNTDNEVGMSHLEHTLQPFWDEEMVVDDGFNSSMVDSEPRFFHHHQYCLIHKDPQGVWELTRLSLADIQRAEKTGNLVPDDSVGNVMFIHTERLASSRNIHSFQVLRLKGN